MTNVFSNLDISEYKNKDEYRAEIENLSNKIAEVYKNNPRLVDLEANRTGNAGEYFGNRKKLLESLVDSFGGYADLDESEKKILIGIGFEFDEETLEIYQVVDQDDIPATLNDLTQLQVALTYLAS